jgi:hypothetical protein
LPSTVEWLGGPAVLREHAAIRASFTGAVDLASAPPSRGPPAASNRPPGQFGVRTAERLRT